MTNILPHLGLGLAAFGTRGCRCRGNVQVGRPIHAIGPRYIVCALFLCPDKAVTHTLWRITCKAWGYGAGKVIVREQVDDDQETGQDGQPWPRKSRENDVD
jgi:hypothetical protein